VKFWCSVSFLDPSSVLDVAHACDDAGFHGVMVADHLAFPEKISSPYPYASDGAPPWEATLAWPDPWVTIGAIGAVTSRVQMSTNIYIAPARHPLVVAKAVSTAAVLSGGRVALGAGVGWMREEFEAAGQDFATRGRRLDEMIEILRALWRGETTEHHGTYYDFDRLSINPVPGSSIPIYGGGDSDAAMRRAARLDGWIGSLYELDDALERAATIRAIRTREGTTDRDDYEVFCALRGRDHELDDYRRLEDAGVTAIMCTPWGAVSRADRGPAPIRAALDEFAERFVHPLA
jgi:probable F420-dependent oxidoreductase